MFLYHALPIPLVLLCIRISLVHAFVVAVVPQPHHQQQQQRLIRSYLTSTVVRSSRSRSSNSDANESMNPEATNTEITKKQQRQPRPSPTGFSYVEEGVYTNLEEEIEAMGGDPSFLVSTTISPADIISPSTSSSEQKTTTDTTTDSTVGLSTGSTGWEWDGVEENEAYFDD